MENRIIDLKNSGVYFKVEDENYKVRKLLNSREICVTAFQQ